MKKSSQLFCAAAVVFAALLLSVGCTDPSARQADATSPVITDNCIPAQAVVHYFLEKERHYFTQQEHVFCPDQKSLMVVSHEPQGRFVWTLGANQYSASNAPEEPGPTDAYWNRALLGASYCLLTYGGEFLTAGEPVSQEPVRIEGQHYLEIDPEVSGLASLRLYRNQTSGKIDLVQVEDKSGTLWMAKSYNWNYYPPTGKLIPRKIDFFDVSNGIPSKVLKIRTDYTNVQ